MGVIEVRSQVGGYQNAATVCRLVADFCYLIIESMLNLISKSASGEISVHWTTASKKFVLP
jgi:hypothetical protein